MHEVPVGVQALERFVPLVGAEPVERLKKAARALRERLGENVIWNINSTARGGGVAELLRPLVGYARGAGVDTRWMVIDAPPEFFRVTKRLHHAFHGSPGDGSPLDGRAHAIYEAGLRANAMALEGLIRHGDIVALHDPQVAGLAVPLAWMGARVVWRCHIGSDVPNPEVEKAWAFLSPYLRPVQRFVFTRAAFIAPEIPLERTHIVPPTIDPFSTKNQDLTPEQVRAILARAHLIAEGPETHGPPTFTRDDGTPGRVDRHATVIRQGLPPPADRPLIVQVSRWDPLKDPVGVMHGFARLVPQLASPRPDLVLAAAEVSAVSDDPEGAYTFSEVVEAWGRLPDEVRRRVHLANLPMQDPEENGVMVNALQRHAAILVQKSLSEGFGLTVTEAMWKGRPVIATATGGIRDQIEDGHSGLLLDDPNDLDRFAELAIRVLRAPDLARDLGVNAHETVRQRFLAFNSLVAWAQVVAGLVEAPVPIAPARATFAPPPA
ncbi:MAG: glycosyltransferase [Myxococcaceae bacterium]|nr:glycosyltransferase [Myxococcaceae bacterium]